MLSGWSAGAKGVAGDVFAALVGGAIVAVLDEPWTRGVWVGALFLLVALSRRVILRAITRRHERAAAGTEIIK